MDAETLPPLPVDVDIVTLRVLLVCVFRLDPERVSAKVITLGLQQIGWQVLGSVAIVEAQRSGESRSRNTPQSALADNISPARLSLVDGLVEEVIEKEIFQLGVTAICACDVLQEN